MEFRNSITNMKKTPDKKSALQLKEQENVILAKKLQLANITLAIGALQRQSGPLQEEINHLSEHYHEDVYEAAKTLGIDLTGEERWVFDGKVFINGN